jgi:Zn-finger nucleic acid-binding protein
MSLFETVCPMCNGTLWIDPSTLKIVDHRAADHQKADLKRFLEESKQDKGWDEKMRKSREEEARRKAEIEEKFRHARENTDINDTSSAGPRSVLDWD